MKVMMILKVMVMLMVIIMAWFPDSFRTLVPGMRVSGSTAIYPARTVTTACRGETSTCR